ncbi:calcium-activated chloride channel regulator 1-like isoform X2 [Amblyomma americanum]
MERGPCFAAALLFLLSTAASLNIDTSDGGYREVWVSISESVPPNQSIIDNIKALFRSSSEFLHKATNGRVYFKQVTIEVPKTWPKRSSARALSSNAFDKSDVRIDMPTKQYGDKPFTHQVKPCGQPGDFIQLTPGFLATLTNSTAKRSINPAYVFVHEWAHFRYGVFDEYGSQGDSRYPLTYCHREKVRLNACSSKIAFVARTADGGTCSMHSNCRFLNDCVVTFYQPPKDNPVESSIMFMPYIANVSQFCDSSDGPRRHNPFAPNKQNDKCKQRSTWDVISENDDFKNLPSPDVSKRIQVTFQEAQQKEDLAQRVVLVLDVSGSMDDHNRIGFLKEAAKRYLGDIEDGSRRLAIVSFSSHAQVVHTLMPVNVNTRHRFLGAIEKLSAYGGTCIGCGLDTALKILKGSVETTEGAFIVLMTDGDENEYPYISEVLPQVIASKVVVSTLALGAAADPKLEELATKTRGKAFVFSDLRGNVALELESAFVSSTTTQADSTARAHTLVQDEEEFTKVLEKKFRVDADVGNSTVVYVKRNSPGTARIQARLIDPNGRPCQACQQSRSGEDIAISIPSPAAVGNWTLHVTSSTSDTVEVSVRVKSEPRTKDDEPIRVSCEMSNMLVDKFDKAIVYAKVTKGKKVVLDAVVFATVYRPKMQDAPQAITIPLHDDGKDPDVHPDDGTYSGYFTQFTGKGRYAVAAHVSNQKTTRLAEPLSGSGSFFTTALLSATTVPAGTSFEPASEYPIHDFVVVNTTTETRNTTGAPVQTVDPFERVASGGSFQVTVEILEKQVPPGDIRDLAVTDVLPGDNDTLMVQLTWTWPGAHLTSGNASAVEIRAGKHYADLYASFENQTEITGAHVVQGNLDPLPSGAQHVVTVSLPSTLSSPRQDGTFNWNVFLAARVANSDGLKSKPSNIVPVSYVPPPVTTTVATTTDATTEATTTKVTTEVTTIEVTTTEVTTTEVTTTEVTTTDPTTTEPPTTTGTLDATKGNSQESRFVGSPLFSVLLACISLVISIAIVITVCVMMNPKKRRIYHVIMNRRRPQTSV